MATVYQESGIRNLDYGDRDSVGLFQQRPSQGWGTEKQLMDPYYATGKFYDALVKIKNWQTARHQRRRPGGAAQRLPRGLPRPRGRRPGAGQRADRAVPGGFTCLDRTGADGDAAGLAAALRKTFGADAKADPRRQGRDHRRRLGDARLGVRHFAVANSAQYGTVQVVVGNQQWDTNSMTLPAWVAAEKPIQAEEGRDHRPLSLRGGVELPPADAQPPSPASRAAMIAAARSFNAAWP